MAGPVGGVIGDSLDAGVGVTAGATTATATSAATVLGENDIVIGFVQNGQIIAQETLGDDAATAMSHEQLAIQNGVLQSPGVLNDGVEAFTVVKQNGQILIRGSNNFNPAVSPGTQALLQQAFQ